MKICLETEVLKKAKAPLSTMSFSEKTREKLLKRPDPNSHLSLLNRYKILLARCLFFSFLFLILLQVAGEGRQRVSERSNPFMEARKRKSGVVGCGLCTAIPPSAAKAQSRATSQTTYRRQILERSMKLRPSIISQETGA